jgi:phosphatidate cytidylyltransferase
VSEPSVPSSPPQAGTAGRPSAPWRSRVVVAAIVIASFLALAVADARGLGGAPPAWWLLPVAIAIAVGGVGELGTLLAARDLPLPGWFLRPAVVAVVLAAALGPQASMQSMLPTAGRAASDWASMGGPAVAYALAVGMLFGIEIVRYRPHGRALERIAAGGLVLAYIGLPLAFMVVLRLLCVENLGIEQTGPGHLGIVPLASLVAVVKAGDIAAYAVGSLLGRHRMAPVLSPGKTWEGAAASLAASIAVACAVPGLAGTGLPWQPWGGWPLFGAAVGAAGMVGDLAESLLKRETGAKDSGRSLGGLGGVLDLVDSLLFAAPVAWLLWVLGR